MKGQLYKWEGNKQFRKGDYELPALANIAGASKQAVYECIKKRGINVAMEYYLTREQNPLCVCGCGHRLKRPNAKFYSQNCRYKYFKKLHDDGKLKPSGYNICECGKKIPYYNALPYTRNKKSCCEECKIIALKEIDKSKGDRQQWEGLSNEAPKNALAVLDSLKPGRLETGRTR